MCVVWRAALALDARLSSYLLAYLLSQLPSVAHRMCQVAGDAPQWLAFAQSATQPAQGLLNLVVFSHHGLGSSRVSAASEAAEIAPSNSVAENTRRITGLEVRIYFKNLIKN